MHLFIEDGSDEQAVLDALRKGRIRIHVSKVQGQLAYLNIEAPKDVRLLRSELERK
ncbi:hypothetical protein 3S11_43 [uncultured Caudovirales phage]|uniref:Carbon storage regulator n=1 Tax=uncultured Caudovirales phage TaxID=2100421 RepID=A0A2H4J5R7_9CAUD|nr:hypothetical protein 3S11_43 [uncultured Caudovirales phage]